MSELYFQLKNGICVLLRQAISFMVKGLLGDGVGIYNIAMRTDSFVIFFTHLFKHKEQLKLSIDTEATAIKLC